LHVVLIEALEVQVKVPLAIVNTFGKVIYSTPADVTLLVKVTWRVYTLVAPISSTLADRLADRTPDVAV